LVPLQCCPLLQELYVAQNKLRKIEGLDGLVHLRTLDLGANRIRVRHIAHRLVAFPCHTHTPHLSHHRDRDRHPQSMQGLETLTSMQSLWLGKNKIEEISGIGHLSKLRQLDVQNNRLAAIGAELMELTALEEVYLACNAIETVRGLPEGSPLSTVDLSNNPLKSLDGIESHPTLEELWMTKSALSTYDDLEPLRSLPALTCVYLEHSPVAQHPDYRQRLVALVPTLEQLDAIVLDR
jgi:protein phosphatase 1 regulatory subunit 7